jgi:predicted nicotinamide N-methyase
MWPSAVVLAQWIATNPTVVQQSRVLELGAGCGLTGLVCARIQQRHYLELAARKLRPSSTTVAGTILTDVNSVVLENLRGNVLLNDLELASSSAGVPACQVAALDFHDASSEESEWKDLQGNPVPAVDVIVGADIICQSSDAVAVARTVSRLLRPGAGRAIIVCADAKHRYGVSDFPEACKQAGLSVFVKNARDLYAGQLMTSPKCRGQLANTTGYVDSMSLTFFFLHKEQV